MARALGSIGAMPRRWRRVLTFGFALSALPACAGSQSLARDAASEAWSCPKEKVVVTDLGDDRYRATGCGKHDVYLCNWVTENAGTPQEAYALKCRSSGTVADEAEKANRKNERDQACASACDRGAESCVAGCDDARCRDSCTTMKNGCLEGCGWTVAK